MLYYMYSMLYKCIVCCNLMCNMLHTCIVCYIKVMGVCIGLAVCIQQARVCIVVAQPAVLFEFRLICVWSLFELSFHLGCMQSLLRQLSQLKLCSLDFFVGSPQLSPMSLPTNPWKVMLRNCWSGLTRESIHERLDELGIPRPDVSTFIVFRESPLKILRYMEAYRVSLYRQRLHFECVMNVS